MIALKKIFIWTKFVEFAQVLAKDVKNVQMSKFVAQSARKIITCTKNNA